MWGRLVGLAAATAGLLALLLWPIGPIDIRVDLPAVRGGGPALSAGEIEAVGAFVSAWATPAIVALVLAGAGWIGWGIVKKHGRAG
jgi:hypothetical protein